MKKKFSIRTLFLAASLLLQLDTFCFHTRGAAGDVDLSFDPDSGVNGPVTAVVVQPDGKVLIGGAFTMVDDLVRANVARLNADGRVDPTFNPAGSLPYSAVSSLALQPDGQVLIAGQVFHSTLCDENGCYDNYISVVLRLNANGSQDISFIPGAGVAGDDYGLSSSLAVQSDGKVLVGGYFIEFNGTTRRGLARLGTNGTPDASFHPGTGSGGYPVGVGSVVVQSDGQILIGGRFTSFDGTNCSSLARLTASGNLDTSFNSGFGVRHYRDCGGDVCYDVAFPTAVTLQPNGQVLVGVMLENWQCDAFGGGCFVSTTYSVMRLNADGSRDPSFTFTNVINNAGVFGLVNSIVVQPDGKIVVGSGANNPVRIARLNADGSLDSSFNPGTGANGSVRTVALQSDGKVLIGGDFTTVNAVSRPYLARFHGSSAAPSLNIARSNALVIVSWSSAATEFVLQQNSNLNSINWATPAETVADNGTSKFISISPTQSSRFFRLFKP